MVKAVKVVGARRYSFKGSRGDDVKMVTLSCLYKDEKTDGVACIGFNVSEKFYIDNKIKVNSSFEFVYAIVGSLKKVVAVFPIEEIDKNK